MKAVNIELVKKTTEEKTPGVLRIFQSKCPRCRRGNMFVEKNPYKLSHTMKMNEQCAECGQVFDIEVGFFYGSSYVSYALSVAISVASFILYWLLVGMSLNDSRFFYWLIINAVLLIGLQPIIMRMARAIWLSFFIRYDKDWRTKPAQKPERVNADQKNNW